VRGVPDERIIGKLERGITIEGKRTVPCEIERMKTTGRDEFAGSGFADA
jgi:16S rRNA U516 pseudouridylate synthase RsuA-like enzyme